MSDAFFIGLSLGTVIGVFVCLHQSMKNKDLIMRLDDETIEMKRVINKIYRTVYDKE